MLPVCASVTFAVAVSPGLLLLAPKGGSQALVLLGPAPPWIGAPPLDRQAAPALTVLLSTMVPEVKVALLVVVASKVAKVPAPISAESAPMMRTPTRSLFVLPTLFPIPPWTLFWRTTRRVPSEKSE